MKLLVLKEWAGRSLNEQTGDECRLAIANKWGRVKRMGSARSKIFLKKMLHFWS